MAPSRRLGLAHPSRAAETGLFHWLGWACSAGVGLVVVVEGDLVWRTPRTPYGCWLSAWRVAGCLRCPLCLIPAEAGFLPSVNGAPAEMRLGWAGFLFRGLSRSGSAVLLPPFPPACPTLLRNLADYLDF